MNPVGFSGFMSLSLLGFRQVYTRFVQRLMKGFWKGLVEGFIWCEGFIGVIESFFDV